MSEWNEKRLLDLITLPQEEDTYYEYKAAEALRFSEDKKKSEFRKDVSAMANGAGGIIVYGMTEREDGSRTLPDQLENVDPIGTSKETMYQVLDSVQRRIDGVEIQPVDLAAGGYVYVIEVPESNTIHMADAKSGRYYIRRGNHVMLMEDHEIRIGLNRSVHPYLEPSFVLWNIDLKGKPRILNGGRQGDNQYAGGTRLTANVKHTGGPLAEKIQLRLDCPTWLMNSIGDRWLWDWNNYHSSAQTYISLFPEQEMDFDLVIGRDLSKMAPFGWPGPPLPDNDFSKIKWTLWADSAAPRRGEIKIDEILRKHD